MREALDSLVLIGTTAYTVMADGLHSVTINNGTTIMGERPIPFPKHASIERITRHEIPAYPPEGGWNSEIDEGE